MIEASRLVAVLADGGLTLATAESLTGGALADAVVTVPGASRVFVGGIVSYATAIKASVLGVDAALLDREGAVHPEVARQMAESARRLFAVDGRDADVGVGTTGVAGPDPQDGHPPGTVHIAVARVGRPTSIWSGHLQGDRQEVRRAAVERALRLAITATGAASGSATE